MVVGVVGAAAAAARAVRGFVVVAFVIVAFVAVVVVIGALPQTAARTSFEQRRRAAAALSGLRPNRLQERRSYNSGTGRQLYLFVFVVVFVVRCIRWSFVGRAGGGGSGGS